MSVKSGPEDVNYVLCNNNKFVRETERVPLYFAQ